MAGYNFNKWAIELQADTENFIKNTNKANSNFSNFAKDVKEKVNDVNSSVKTMGNSMSSSFKSTAGAAKGMSGKVSSLFGGLSAAGGALAAAAVLLALKFGKACLDVGVKMEKVQRQVDIAFPKMKGEIDKFAKKAVDSFGMTELSAKQFTSSLGIMLKTMGLTEWASAEMSMDMVKLSGQMAAYYGMEPDQMFEKVRSSIEGQSSSLKDLGINMSNANLQNYAMANGITKSYAEMTEAEKALLRYQYLINVTKDAQKGVTKNTNTWSGQTRLLSLRFKEFMGVLGQGLVYILKPFVVVLNYLMQGLLSATKFLGGFFKGLFGGTSKKVVTSVKKIGDGFGGINKGYSDVALNAADGAEKKADKAEKKAKKAKKTMLSVLSFDKLNKLSDPGSEENGSGGKEEELKKAQDVTKQIAQLNGGLGSLANTKIKVPGLDLSALNTDSVVDEAAKSGEELGKYLKGDLWSDLGKWFSETWDKFKKWCSDLWEGLCKWCEETWNGLGKWCSDTWTKFKKWCSDTWNGLGKWISDTWGKFKKWCSDTWNGLGKWCSDTWGKFKKWCSDLWDGISKWATETWNKFKKWIGDLKDGFCKWCSDTWDNICKWFGDVGKWFTDRFNEAVDGIKNAFKGIGKWFEGVWNDILGVFSKGGKIFEGVKEGVSSVFKTAVNFLLKGVNAVIAAPFKVINGVMNTIRGFNLPVIGKVFAGLWKQDPVPVPQIPALASGGTVEAGQLFLAREKGPELVGGGNGRSTVMNNNQIVEAVSAGVSNAVMEVLMAMKQNDNSNNEPMNITMEIDGEKVGVAAIKGVNKRNERYRTKLAII